MPLPPRLMELPKLAMELPDLSPLLDLDLELPLLPPMQPLLPLEPVLALPPMEPLMALAPTDWILPPSRFEIPVLATLFDRAPLLDWEGDSAQKPSSSDERQREREQEARERAEEAKQRDIERKERVNEYYEACAESVNESRWDRAVDRCDRVIAAGSPRADGAMYWKAYAQNKLGRKADALATLAEMQKAHPQSRWLGDAKALEVEVRQSSGQNVNPADVSDEELKLQVIQSMMTSGCPEEYIPALDKVLKGTSSPRLKERALFVLSQCSSPKGRELIGQIARGQGNPDLQRRALKYIALHSGRESQQILADVYKTTNDVDVKRTIINSFMISGAKDRLFEIAKTEPDPNLRSYATNQLGVMGAQTELWQLYGTETSVDVKRRILNSMFVGGSVDRLLEIARTEKNPDLRKAAIKAIGLTGKGGDALVGIYAGEPDKEIKKTVLNALFLQNNARSMIEIARKENDPELKKSAVHWLSLMNSKEATAFMLELLNK